MTNNFNHLLQLQTTYSMDVIQDHTYDNWYYPLAGSLSMSGYSEEFADRVRRYMLPSTRTPITTYDEMVEMLDTFYEELTFHGVETETPEIVHDQFAPETYAMCTENTQVLGEVYNQHIAYTEPERKFADVGELLQSRGETVATAESCTGGLAAKLLTDVAGSSAYFVSGVVTYSNASKVSLLGVEPSTLEEHGAVSAPVAEQMAVGVRDRLGSTWGLSATGIAGPGGGSTSKPVGLVYLGLAGPGHVEHRRVQSPGDRFQVRRNSALSLMDILRRHLVSKEGRD